VCVEFVCVCVCACLCGEWVCCVCLCLLGQKHLHLSTMSDKKVGRHLEPVVIMSVSLLLAGVHVSVDRS
jgi:hypothetical protein